LQSSLEGLDEKRRNLAGDIDKFKKFIKTLESKKIKMLEIIQKTKEDIVERGKEIEHAEREKIRLQRILEKQEISAADVEKMNVQKDKLERRCTHLFKNQIKTKTSFSVTKLKVVSQFSLRSFTEQKEALTKMVWEREMVVAKKLQLVRFFSSFVCFLLVVSH